MSLARWRHAREGPSLNRISVSLVIYYISLVDLYLLVSRATQSVTAYRGETRFRQSNFPSLCARARSRTRRRVPNVEFHGGGGRGGEALRCYSEMTNHNV